MNKKIILVTGSNRGIGLAACKSLLHNGHHVIATSRNPDHKDQLLTELSPFGSVEYVQVDVQDEQSINDCFSLVESNHGRLDCLVNNAGILYDHNIAQTSGSELTEVFQTNVLGPFLLSKAAIPLLKKSSSAKIINVTSQLGSLENSGPGFAAYRISKTALNSLTRLLHHELEGANIKAYSVCPGWVHTDMGGPSAPRTPAQGASSILFPFYNDVESGSYIQDGRRLNW